jgi:tetratricopeptide (TPR) repeat protein
MDALLESRDNELQGRIDEYTAVIAKSAEDTVPYIKRGDAYLGLRKFDDALADYNTAVQLGPSPDGYFARGYYFKERGQLELAISDFDRAIEMYPAHANAYHWRSFCHRKQGNLDEAITDSTKAIELDPSLYAALLNRAFSYRAKGDNKRAEADLDRAKLITPASSADT